MRHRRLRHVEIAVKIGLQRCGRSAPRADPRCSPRLSPDRRPLRLRHGNTRIRRLHREQTRQAENIRRGRTTHCAPRTGDPAGGGPHRRSPGPTKNQKPCRQARAYPTSFPKQHLGNPASRPSFRSSPCTRRRYRGSGKLEGMVALITGGDFGIRRAVAVLCAREGADVAITLLDRAGPCR